VTYKEWNKELKVGVELKKQIFGDPAKLNHQKIGFSFLIY